MNPIHYQITAQCMRAPCTVLSSLMPASFGLPELCFLHSRLLLRVRDWFGPARACLELVRCSSPATEPWTLLNWLEIALQFKGSIGDLLLKSLR